MNWGQSEDSLRNAKVTFVKCDMPASLDLNSFRSSNNSSLDELLGKSHTPHTFNKELQVKFFLSLCNFSNVLYSQFSF